MSEQSNPQEAGDHDQSKTDPRPRIGADLIIPVAALAFAAYYIWSVLELPWMAQFNGIFLTSTLVLLIVMLMVRNVYALSKGTARFSFADLKEDPGTTVRRWGLFGLAIAFASLISIMGFTLSILLFLILAMVLLGVRPWTKLFSIAFGMTAAGYILFIVALGARLPHGPIEQLLAGQF